MGRRSLATERRQQIIAVTIQCMSKHGLDGTTLERIAEHADMTRGHLRHFVGNRDELLTDAARVFFFGNGAMDEKDLAVAVATLPIIPRSLGVEGALAFLFDEFVAPSSDSAAVTAFIDAGRTIPAILEIVASSYRSMEISLAEIISDEHPRAHAASCRRVANAAVSMAVGTSFLTNIEYSTERIAHALAITASLIAGVERSS